MNELALVIPWFGADLAGGAEQLAYQLARRLAARGHAVEVLTTCCRSFHDDWATDHYPPGEARAEEGFVVRRFPVDARDRPAFEESNRRLLAVERAALRPGVSPVGARDAATFVAENINSSALLAHLRERAGDYRAFIFLPYLYGPTLRGLPLVPRPKAYLQPCLHDEPYAYLPATESVIHAAHVILFNSLGESLLARRLYGPGLAAKSALVGLGIEPAPQDAAAEPSPFAAPPASRYVLALGRRDATKNTDLLVRAFRAFRERHPEAGLQLLLAGPGRDSFASETAGIFDLGLVDETTKAVLLSHCLALFQPSRNESYSRVMMEAWQAGRPAAAHRACLATAAAVEASGGGWLAETEEEWADLFARVERAAPAALDELGSRGRAYAAEHGDWNAVLDRYEEALGLRVKASAARVAPRGLGAIHQLLPNLTYGDAISNQALEIRRRLGALGYASEIFVKHLDEKMRDAGRVFAPQLIENTAGLIYHHSIGTELTAVALRHAGPKCLIYHNITPAEFFAPYRPGFAWMLETGRAELAQLARDFAISVGDSAFNAAELSRCGFRDPGVLPIIVNPAKWDMSPDPLVMERLQDGAPNVLFVGRFSPHKRQDRLVEAFSHFVRLEPESRLILAGDGLEFDPYYRHVLRLIKARGLAERVEITGLVDDARLAAYYRTAHLFWSMSAHEGFGVPPVEAMWFEVPVLAARTTATPETLADAGVLFDEETDAATLAPLAQALIRDAEHRARVLRRQAARRERFLPEAVWPVLDALIRRLETERPAPP